MNKSIKLALLLMATLPSFAFAKSIKTNTAQMQALDKVTGRIKVIEVPVGGNVNFGTFSVLVRDCQTTPPEETPENYAFVDVVDSDVDGNKANIFRGWMLSSTPSLNAVEHPIYDVWLLKCIDTEFDKKLLLTDADLEARNKLPAPVKIGENLSKEPILDPVNEAIPEVVMPQTNDNNAITAIAAEEPISEEPEMQEPEPAQTPNPAPEDTTQTN